MEAITITRSSLSRIDDEVTLDDQVPIIISDDDDQHLQNNEEEEALMAASSLPRLMVVKSVYNNKYLHYIHENVQVHSLLQFEGSDVLSPYTKLEVEIAGSGLVHIRSSYNNKYWGRFASNNNWIAAKHDEKEEDQSKWSCTLFQPVSAGLNGRLRFRHVQTGKFACLWRAAAPYNSCLLASSASPDPSSCDIFTVIDWSSLVILPKHIVFKGDNGKYLKAYQDRADFLRFVTDDIGEEYVPNEVFTNGDGSVRLRSDFFGMFWNRDPSDWILCTAGTGSSNDSSYVPIKLADNVIALRNKGNNHFIRRYTDPRASDCLKAVASTIDAASRLQVEEAVVSRTIDSLAFRLIDARIYGEKIIVVVTQQVTNRTQVPNTIQMDFRTTDSWTSTWNTSLSLKLGVKQTLSASVPFVVEASIEFSYEFTSTYDWGESVTKSQQVGSLYTVTVPPMSMVKVGMIATEASCDIPFSYMQNDVLINGTPVRTQKHDGIYTGISSFNFQYEAEQFELDPAGNPIMSSGKKMTI